MKVSAAHAEFFRSLGAIAFGLFQGLDDEFLFGLLDRQVVAGQDLSLRYDRICRRIAYPRWQITRGDPIGAAQDHRVLHSGAQFANVSRPTIAQQQIHCFGREPAHFLVVGFGEFFEEGLGRSD